MSPARSNEPLSFSSYTIRGLIGAIAMLLPVVVFIRAARITPSISWSYYTNARDLFVGLLFVIGAFMVSYQGRKHTVQKKAASYRKWAGERQEQLVALVGGLAAGATAVAPTAACAEFPCPSDPAGILVPTACRLDPIAMLHYTGAVILFSATVYFCLFAFVRQARAKLKAGQGSPGPKQLRIGVYYFCGWGILVTMAASIVAALTGFNPISNFTFWTETIALELFGFAWLTASHYLPYVTDEAERQQTPVEQAIRQSQ